MVWGGGVGHRLGVPHKKKVSALCVGKRKLFNANECELSFPFLRIKKLPVKLNDSKGVAPF